MTHRVKIRLPIYSPLHQAFDMRYVIVLEPTMLKIEENTG